MRRNTRAFTVIELLVVVSIIALLVGILLPAIGKAREQAQLTRSQGNMKQMGTAAQTYSADWNDRQFTAIVDNFASYGTSGPAAAAGYAAANGVGHPPMLLGTGDGGGASVNVWAYWFPPPIGTNANWEVIVPLHFGSGFGAFRMINNQNFSNYLNGRFYDPVFYAPKDTIALAAVEPWFDRSADFSDATPGGDPFWSSYCFSPAAMFSPDVLGFNRQSKKYYTNPFDLPAGYRSPSMGQAQFPDLKTHIIEHHWLQNRRKLCNAGFTGGTYEGCEPFYFNHGWNSAPVSLFFDGHIEQMSCKEAMDSANRLLTQTNIPGSAITRYATWTTDTPMGGSFAFWGSGGYFSDYSFDNVSTSFHILTTDGIKGRDIIAK